MKIAIPVVESMVSTSFDFARDMMVADIDQEQGQVLERKVVRLQQSDPCMRVRQLMDHKVDVLICGAISRMLAGHVNTRQIQIVPFIRGSVDDVLNAYLNGSLTRKCFRLPGPMPRLPGLGRGCGRRFRGGKRPGK